MCDTEPMSEQMVDVSYVGDDVEVMTETGRIETVSTREVGWGPGVWRRVLHELESRGIEDRHHVMLAWKFDLMGPWNY